MLWQAVLGIAVLLHLTLSMLTHAHAAHQHAPGAQQPAVGIGSGGAHAAIVVPTRHDPRPCPCPFTEHDHNGHGAAAGAPIIDARPLSPAGPATGQLMIVANATASAPSPAWRRHGEQPSCPPSGTALLILNSVSRV